MAATETSTRKGVEPGTNGAHHVVIAGGGIAAVEATLALRELGGDRVAVEVLSPSRELTFRPLAVGEPFGISRAADLDLATVTDGAGAELRIDTLVGVDAERRIVRTHDGPDLAFDSLIIACGALVREGLPGAIHFAGPDSVAEINDLLNEIEMGRVRRLLFALPYGPSWALPLYELALLTEAWLSERGIRSTVELAIATSEDAPLAAFGSAASATVAELVEARGIELRTGAHVREVGAGVARLVPEGEIAADRVVALPRAAGPAIDGLPSDAEGFLPIDEHCAVAGADSVYAAGDATNFPIKQGGIACEQAAAAAETIARAAGVAIEPSPFKPGLRAVLLTGERPEFLRVGLRGGEGETSAASEGPLWWPPGKVAGKYLGPYLHSLADEQLRPPGA